MKIFIAGITGATGRLLAEQLLDQKHTVIGYARNLNALPDSLTNHPNLAVEQGSLLDVADHDLQNKLNEVDAIACCLGHTMSRQGIWGDPKTLVTDVVNRLVALRPDRPIRLVLMNSNGVANPWRQEKFSMADRIVISILRKILPPHRDNELAAATVQQLTESNIEWCIVRPDNLRDATDITTYQAFETQQKGVVFKSGFTSRINVAGFMQQLMTDNELWQTWKGKWPVLYNSESL